MVEANYPTNYLIYERGQWSQEAGEVITETPVALSVNGESWLTFMCTPIHLEAMAVGFLYNEGIIQSKAQIADIRLCAAGDHLDIWLHHQAKKPEKWRRTSGCTGGVTAVEIEQPAIAAERLNLYDGAALSAGQVTDLVSQLFDAQDLYKRSGGVHTSALSDGEHILVTAEDIGRHNTLDKIAGRLLMEEITTPRRILLTTGRISSEMMQKSARMGAGIVISRTSPSSMSVSMAEQWGITLIGYARRAGFKVYAHPERIIQPKSNKENKDTILTKKNGNQIHETQ